MFNLDNFFIPQILSIVDLQKEASSFYLPSYTREQVKTFVEKKEACGFVKNNELKSVIIYKKLPEALEIIYLATKSTELRRGFMTKLLQRFIEFAKKDQRSVWLEIHEKNTSALCCYRSLGFRAVGSRSSYYGDGASALLMSF